MAEFPRLQTGAVAQYPSSKHSAYSTQVIAYVDGSETRIRDRGQAVRRWVLKFDHLSPEELTRIEEFVIAQQGGAGVFEFTDPWTGDSYPQCRFTRDALELILRDEARSSTELVIETVRTP